MSMVWGVDEHWAMERKKYICKVGGKCAYHVHDNGGHGFALHIECINEVYVSDICSSRQCFVA